MGTKSHPTAYTIFDELKSEIPSLSKTTVYNVLKLLIEKKLVKEIRIEDHELRFDAEMKEHGHFKCSVCGNVSDIFLNQELKHLIEQKNKITEIQFNITGVCESCLKSK
jgi:Fe2+ or Zn2+ uptake regulation protein